MNTSNAVISIIAFCIALFLYVHINYHLNKSDDLDVYHIEYPSKDKLDEICALRQPVVFASARLENELVHLQLNQLLQTYHDFDVCVRKTNTNTNPNAPATTDNEKYLPIKLHHAVKLVHSNQYDSSTINSQSTTSDPHPPNNETDTMYYSENNQEFLRETGILKHIKKAEYMLRPSLVLSSKYDLLFGSKHAYTPLRYNIFFKNYFALVSGKATFMFASPKSCKYLQIIEDYDNFEFQAVADSWNKTNLDSRIKFLEVTLQPNQILHIPPYWLYSVRFDQENTTITTMHYDTYMSYASTSQHHLKYHMQKQNIRYKLPTFQTNESSVTNPMNPPKSIIPTTPAIVPSSFPNLPQPSLPSLPSQPHSFEELNNIIAIESASPPESSNSTNNIPLPSNSDSSSSLYPSSNLNDLDQKVKRKDDTIHQPNNPNQEPDNSISSDVMVSKTNNSSPPHIVPS